MTNGNYKYNHYKYAVFAINSIKFIAINSLYCFFNSLFNIFFLQPLFFTFNNHTTEIRYE